MALRDIVLYPDKPLCVKCTPFDRIDGEVADLAHDMIETMIAFDGVGLAGPQVGVEKRIFVLCEPEGEPKCLVNPEITLMEGSAEGEEGCLSLPQVYALVPRAVHIHVRAANEYGKILEFDAENFLARIIQHENDHLDGLVFPDRLDILSREDVLRQWEEIRRLMTAEVQKSPVLLGEHRTSQR